MPCPCGMQASCGSGGCGDKPQKPFKYDDDLKRRLSALVSSAPIIVFIKGSPIEPKCKFTRQLLLLFATKGIAKFSHFDILSDNEVREGLRVYSQWKTFPQVYIKGEFVGGVDVVIEMARSSELDEKIPGNTRGKVPPVAIARLLTSQKGLVLFSQGPLTKPVGRSCAKAVAVLKQAGVKFEYHDVSAIPGLRQGLAEEAGLDDLPQLWADNNLIAGFPEEDEDVEWLKEFVPPPKQTQSPGIKA